MTTGCARNDNQAPGIGRALSPSAQLSTRMREEPDALPLVAVIVTFPCRSPRTRPSLSTVAIRVSPLVHVTAAPGMTLPRVSYTVAVRRNEPPAPTVAVAGVTSTRWTVGGSTMTCAVPLRPSLVAVIVAVPGATAITSPDEETVATCDALDAHETTRPLSG